MNHKTITFLLGQIFKIVTALLAVPFITSAIYGELSDPKLLLAYIVPATALLAIGFVFTQKRPENFSLHTKDGIITVGISWIMLSVFGALPFFFGTMKNPIYSDITFIDWLFESVSGFTTTGSTILSGAQIEKLSKGLLMWRSLSVWIGGMGILLFVLALIPQSSGSGSMNLVQAETTGYSVGKLVSKTAVSAKILYYIYTAMTFLQLVLLLPSAFFEGGTGLFDAIILSIGTAGTGGFTANALNLGGYNVYVQVVSGIFMFLFGISFNIYFLIIAGKTKDIIKNEELRFYVGILFAAFLLIALNFWLNSGTSFLSALPYAAFTSVSVMTSTGFDITAAAGLPYFTASWHTFSRIILLVLMFVGACGGSTGGGLKCSRTLIIIKSAIVKCKSTLNPRAVYSVKLNGKKIDEKTLAGINNYFVLYIGFCLVLTMLISLDPMSAADGQPFFTSLSAAAACIGNVGSGLTPSIGTVGSYFGFLPSTKIIMSFAMLLGRLEIYPILLLFMPKTYSRI